MRIITKVAHALQRLFGPCAEQAAQASNVIVRQRKFTPESLAQTFVLGHLCHPGASDEQLARMAVQCGADVTPQAIEQRHTPQLVNFLKELFSRATQLIVRSEKALAPLLERFRSVDLLDSSTVTLPDELQEEFPGCGGSHGGGAAALKLQTEWDLRGGGITCVQIEPGRSPDAATSRQQARRGPGSLRITDLGYFNVGVFADMQEHDEYFLSRLQFGTGVLTPEGEAIDVLAWLAEQPGPFVDQPILLGQGQRLPCRVIAWRLPQEQADRRRQKLRKEMISRKGQEPTEERLQWCDWTILVTNVPVEKLTAQEAAILYRARWQVELLFKRWKSQGLIAMLSGSTVVRQMVGMWSRLVAVLVQHWLVIASAWGNPVKSLAKVCEAIRDFVGRVAASLARREDVEAVLEDLCMVVLKTCQRNKRSDPGTFELLNDCSLLDFDLT